MHPPAYLTTVCPATELNAIRQRLQRQIDGQLSSIVEPCPPASPHRR